MEIRPCNRPAAEDGLQYRGAGILYGIPHTSARQSSVPMPPSRNRRVAYHETSRDCVRLSTRKFFHIVSLVSARVKHGGETNDRRAVFASPSPRSDKPVQVNSVQCHLRSTRR